MIREAHNVSWDKYISNIENDIHGRQRTAYKIMKHLNKDEKDIANLQILDYSLWFEYCKNLWTNEYEEEIELDTPEIRVKTEIDNLEFWELEQAIKNSKNKKAPGQDGINTELLKYIPDGMKFRLLNILNQCWQQKKIPEEWKTSLIVPIFKKGDKTKPENYRGISLLNSVYKLYI